MKKIKYHSGFSLIEIMVGILIVSFVIVAGFQTLSAIGIGKIKLVERAEIEKHAYFAAERFFEMVKKGGTLDHEEYWNRSSFDTTFSSGFYTNPSGFGNFGAGGNIGSSNYGNILYYCRSPEGGSMGTGGCLLANNTETESLLRSQRYGQYEQQFIDRNSDGDNDGGDEDGDGDILGDDDDLFLGEGPEAFSGSRVGELYLISPGGTERTYFRWNVILDPNAPSGATCSGTQNMTGSGCLGTIEFLKLEGRDYGYDHDESSNDVDGSQNDGRIDTWLIHSDFNSGNTGVVAGSNTENYWQSVFPDTLNVSRAEFYVYPNKSLEYAWRSGDEQYQLAPYVQIKMTLSPSWKQKKKIRGGIPSVDFITTISLTELDFR